MKPPNEERKLEETKEQKKHGQPPHQTKTGSSIQEAIEILQREANDSYGDCSEVTHEEMQTTRMSNAEKISEGAHSEKITPRKNNNGNNGNNKRI